MVSVGAAGFVFDLYGGYQAFVLDSGKMASPNHVTTLLYSDTEVSTGVCWQNHMQRGFKQPELTLHHGLHRLTETAPMQLRSGHGPRVPGPRSRQTESVTDADWMRQGEAGCLSAAGTSHLIDTFSCSEMLHTGGVVLGQPQSAAISRCGRLNLPNYIMHGTQHFVCVLGDT